MRHILPFPHFLLLTVLLLTGILLTQGCGGKTAEPQLPDVYTIRGEIRRLPAEGKSPRELWVYHEDIPDFKDSQGEVVGMEAMTMPFPLADEVSLEGFAVGDRVEGMLEVRWDGKPPVVLSKIGKLAANATAPASSE